MPNDTTGREISLRRFDGVNALVDQAFLGPTFLRRAQNWFPGDTFRIQKRPGNATYAGSVVAGATRVASLIRGKLAGNRYLYGVDDRAVGTDLLVAWTNDGVATAVASGNFAASDLPAYGMTILNDVLYVGNGVDPIKSVPLGGTATDLAAIANYTDSSGVASVVADTTASQILTGSYAYCWCIFDHTANVWLERGTTKFFTIVVGSDQAIKVPITAGFATNGAALSTRYRAHLFIAPEGFPVEFAHDHLPEGLPANADTLIRAITSDGPTLPFGGALSRTGRIFRGHRGRLWFSGDASNPGNVYATSVLVPGYEQSIFNAGLFFPVNARLPRFHTAVTGLGIAGSVARAGDAPLAPIAITTPSSTWLMYGDIMDDPSAHLEQVSSQVGCIAPDTMQETPYGLLYCGLQSVYLIPSGGGLPLDVGWPIRPFIESIPFTSWGRCFSTYHKGFFKLWIVPPGATTATQSWWLDLRQGITSVPSWWGPHTHPAMSCAATGQEETTERDRMWVAIESTGLVEVAHQLNSTTENAGASTIVASLETGDLDDTRPFDRKLLTRVRCIGFPEKTTAISVNVTTDGGLSTQPFDPLHLTAPTGMTWNVSAWDVDTWGQTSFTEGESVAPDDRPRGRSFRVQLTHADSCGVAIRDLLLDYTPIPRGVRVQDDMPES